MARARPDDRLERLVDAAIAVFMVRGYRRTQMADVAQAMGLAPGTLYLYVESKEALFDLVVQRAFVDRAAPAPTVPVPTPTSGATLRHLRRRVTAEIKFPQLEAALTRRKPAAARAELEGIVRELYAFISSHRMGIRLVERCALDWPELAALFYVDIRRGLLARLTQYLERRIAQKRLRPLPHPPAAARLLLETVSWFAMHRHGDADSTLIEDASAEETVVDALVHAFARE
jgi:AcrR family transcriptional regulator